MVIECEWEDENQPEGLQPKRDINFFFLFLSIRHGTYCL